MFHLLEGASRRGNFTGLLPLRARRCASSCGDGAGREATRMCGCLRGGGRKVGTHPLPSRHLVNRDNCVQKPRGTLIVTWQANRMDTPLSIRRVPPPPPRFTPFHGVRLGRWLLNQISLRRIRAYPCIAIVLQADACGRHGARNERTAAAVQLITHFRPRRTVTMRAIC